MEKMRYKLGIMDLYPIAANKTQIENNPFLQAKLKEPVVEERLYAAVKQSLCDHPLFACTLRYKKEYYLETNEKEFTLIRASEENRPLAFGDATNGFLWQICYDEYTISFDSNGGTDVAPLVKHFGETIQAPTVPTKTGYKFVGWFDQKLQNKYNFETNETVNESSSHFA